jgi:hypothetical protein
MTVVAPVSRADLLVYESFSGYTAGALNGQTATGTGLTGNYATTAGSGAYSVTNTGLGLFNLPSAGGAVNFSVNSGVNVGAALDLGAASPVNGTLYTSYLYRKGGNFSTDAGSLVEMRVNDTQNGTSAASRFRTQANTDTTSSNNFGAGYDATPTVGTGTAFTDNANPFLIIGRFTNVGVAGSTGTATLFAMNATQYESYKAAADPENYLDTTAVGTGPTQIWARVSDSGAASTYNFQSGNFLQLAAFGSAGSAQGGTFDELRVGTLLTDVAPVPEPGSAALVAVAAGAALGRRRRRTA